MAKYIIELEQIKGTNLYRAKGANTLVFDENGIKNILTPYEEKKEKEVDWAHVAVDTPILVRDFEASRWERRHFAAYKDGYVYAWDNGGTSWSKEDDGLRATEWTYAKLAEGEYIE